MNLSNNEFGPSVVLVVDDDPTTRLLAREFLGQGGFIVQEAADGESALEQIPKLQPDVVLLDISMPGIDGYSLCRKLRGDMALRDLPIMMLTSNEDLGSIQQAYDSGATDFTSKPVNWPLLSHRLLYLLRSADMVASLRDAQASSALGSWLSMPDTNAMKWSDELFRQLGFEPSATQASWESLLQRVPSHEHANLVEAKKQAVNEQPVDIRHCLILPDDSERVVRHRIKLIPRTLDRPPLLRGTVQDITDLHQASSRIYHLAYFDPLTDLANRTSFNEHLERSLALARRYNRKMAVIYLDLDDFKRINDTLGHSAGDMLLQEVANRLNQAVRESDVVGRISMDPTPNNLARLGGDEFAIILSEVQSESDANDVARRILNGFSCSFSLDENVVYTTPSIGIACYPRDGETPELLLKYADSAMYEAKRIGKNSFRCYDKELSEKERRKNKLDQLLRAAMAKQELTVVYQPQLDVSRNCVNAVEALLRWNTEEFGAVSPVEFVPIAEENGLIVPIGEWVLETACRQFKTWREQGCLLERVSVNVSVKQFAEPDFSRSVAAILNKTGCKPGELDLEITESVLALDAESAVETLNDLKNLGVNLSIDDFGTGYSSLSYLRQFPIDRLKIDRSFIRDIAENSDDLSITSAVIGIARSLDLKVLAEGVETENQLNLLCAKGCDEIQGYYISRPCSADEVAGYFDAVTPTSKQAE